MKGISQTLYHSLFKLFCFALKSLGYRLYMHTAASNQASTHSRFHRPAYGSLSQKQTINNNTEMTAQPANTGPWLLPTNLSKSPIFTHSRSRRLAYGSLCQILLLLSQNQLATRLTGKFNNLKLIFSGWELTHRLTNNCLLSLYELQQNSATYPRQVALNYKNEKPTLVNNMFFALPYLLANNNCGHLTSTHLTPSYKSYLITNISFHFIDSIPTTISRKLCRSPTLSIPNHNNHEE